jgi:6-phosphogluconolactonase (cycloisomerase 2 family)
MGSKKWVKFVLLAPLFLVGCKGFWNAVGSSDFTLSNSGTITVGSPGATSGNTSTVTVTPSSSFSGAVALTCAVTTSPSNATSPVTCSLSPTTVTLSSSTAQTATLTASTTSTTTTGTYEITVTGTSGSASTTATVCVIVGTSSGTCSSGASNSGNFYVMNVETKQIAGFYVNAGTLTALSGGTVTVPATPLSLAIAPNGGLLFVGTADGVYVYTISSTGALTLGNSSGPITSDQAISMQVSPDNDWLLEVASGAPYVYAIPIDSSTGAVTSKTEQYAVLPASSVQQVAISADESYVFVAMGADGTATIPFTAANANPFGAVSRIAPVNSAGAAISVAVDPIQSGQTAPRLFYIGETAATSGTNTGGLRAFNFSTRTEVSGSPFATQGLAPYSILPISTGNYVYVVNRQVSGSTTGVIAGYSISSSSSTYSLTALGSVFAVGTSPVAMAEDSTGTFVFAVDYGGSPDLEGYTFNSTNAGYLDSAVSSATGTDPVQASGIVAAP